MAIKTGNCKRRCHGGEVNPDGTISANGELYRFIGGKARVPGVWSKGPTGRRNEVFITLGEFNHLMADIKEFGPEGEPDESSKEWRK